jgi:hypothetical protein
MKHSAEERRANTMPSPENDIDSEFFQLLKPPAHEKA